MPNPPAFHAIDEAPVCANRQIPTAYLPLLRTIKFDKQWTLGYFLIIDLTKDSFYAEYQTHVS